MAHPMIGTDRDVVHRIISKSLDELTNEDIVNVSRLLIRYSGLSDSEDLRSDILMALHQWNKTPDQLQAKAKQIWQSGWRPGQLVEDEVGSGADVTAGCGQ